MDPVNDIFDQGDYTNWLHRYRKHCTAKGNGNKEWTDPEDEIVEHERVGISWEDYAKMDRTPSGEEDDFSK